MGTATTTDESQMAQAGRGLHGVATARETGTGLGATTPMIGGGRAGTQPTVIFKLLRGLPVPPGLLRLHGPRPLRRHGHGATPMELPPELSEPPGIQRLHGPRPLRRHGHGTMDKGPTLPE